MLLETALLKRVGDVMESATVREIVDVSLFRSDILFIINELIRRME